MEISNDRTVIIVGIYVLYLIFFLIYCTKIKKCINYFAINVHNFNNSHIFSCFQLIFKYQNTQTEAKYTILTLKHNLVDKKIEHNVCWMRIFDVEILLDSIK